VNMNGSIDEYMRGKSAAEGRVADGFAVAVRGDGLHGCFGLSISRELRDILHQ
jgi:hypothetical protein